MIKHISYKRKIIYKISVFEIINNSNLYLRKIIQFIFPFLIRKLIIVIRNLHYLPTFENFMQCTSVSDNILLSNIKLQKKNLCYYIIFTMLCYIICISYL